MKLAKFGIILEGREKKLFIILYHLCGISRRKILIRISEESNRNFGNMLLSKKTLVLNFALIYEFIQFYLVKLKRRLGAIGSYEEKKDMFFEQGWYMERGGMWPPRP